MAKTVYIFSNGTLSREGNTLCFKSEEGKRFLPVEDVQEILVFGEIDMNKRLLQFLSQNQIILHFFNYYEYYMGSFYPREHYNSGYLILRQAEHYLNEKKRIALARKFVAGALRNMLQVLKYYHKRGVPLREVIEKLTLAEDNLAQPSSISELMALEGNSREEYYKAFDLITNNPDFVFEKRSRRPPKNNLNTLLSFCNSLLYSTVLSEVYKTHLDPRIGYLHATNFRRFTLNLDLAEIFRPLLVDRLIFSLIDKRIIQANGFEKKTEGILLKENGKKRIVEEYDKRLRTTIQHRKLGRKVSYRQLIRMEAYKLEKHLLGQADYEPFVSLW